MKKEAEYSYLFGPVPSRRLGISLGVDLVPYKTCTMDCVYCESGRTTDLRIDRKEFYPTQDIINELDHFLSGKPNLDYITFSGAGEPTLHSGIGAILLFLKTTYPSYKVALLTNGMLLTNKELFNEVKGVDLIVPSLDAISKDIYKKINRPVLMPSVSELINSYKEFHNDSSALFYLEILFIPNLNDSESEVAKFAEAINIIKPDKVQLNSLDRPGTESWVTKSDIRKITYIRDYFVENCPGVDIDIVTKFVGGDKQKDHILHKNPDEQILDLIKRRPATFDDLITSTGYFEGTLKKVLHRMLEKKIIVTEVNTRGEFYKKL